MPRYASRFGENDDDRFESVREALASDYASLPDESLERLIENLYPGADPADIESFFSTLKKAGKAAAKFGKKALPGVIQGATSGAALGPFGAIAGGLAGGAMSGLSKGGGRKGGGIPGGVMGAVGGLAKRIPGGAAVTGVLKSPIGKAVTGMAAPAAAQLLRTVNRPEVTQALQALAMGPAGKKNINVGGVSVPTAAITTALRGLLERAETELHEQAAGESSETPLYLLDQDGEFAVDPTDEYARAERVLEILAYAEAAESMAEAPERAAHERYAEDDGDRAAEYDDEYDGEWDDEDAEDEEDDVDAAAEARVYYPGVYESTLRR